MVIFQAPNSYKTIGHKVSEQNQNTIASAFLLFFKKKDYFNLFSNIHLKWSNSHFTCSFTSISSKEAPVLLGLKRVKPVQEERFLIISACQLGQELIFENIKLLN